MEYNPTPPPAGTRLSSAWPTPPPAGTRLLTCLYNNIAHLCYLIVLEHLRLWANLLKIDHYPDSWLAIHLHTDQLLWQTGKAGTVYLPVGHSCQLQRRGVHWLKTQLPVTVTGPMGADWLQTQLLVTVTGPMGVDWIQTQLPVTGPMGVDWHRHSCQLQGLRGLTGYRHCCQLQGLWGLTGTDTAASYRAYGG